MFVKSERVSFKLPPVFWCEKVSLRLSAAFADTHEEEKEEEEEAAGGGQEQPGPSCVAGAEGTPPQILPPLLNHKKTQLETLLG